MSTTNLRYRGIYELCIVAKQSQPEILNENLIFSEINVNDYLKRYENKEDPRGKHVKLNYTTKVIDQLSERITCINNGIPATQPLGRKYYQCLKTLRVAEILNNLSKNNAAILAAQLSIKRAKKYYFSDIVFQAAVILYNIHNRNANIIEEKRAVSLYREYFEYYRIEKDIEIDRNNIFHYYNSTQSTNEQITLACEKAISKYAAYENKIPSFKFHNCFFLFKHIVHSNRKNHLAVFNNANNAIAWFSNLVVENIAFKAIYTHILISYTIQKKQFDKSRTYIGNMLKQVAINSPNWYRLKENELILNFHSGEYNEACKIFFETYKTIEFNGLSTTQKDRWTLYHAYVRLLIESNNASYSGTKSTYSISKFINDLPVFSQDKRAMNIPLLIAQLLFLIIRRDFESAGDRISALQKYTKRYLKNDETFRSSCLIKMLLEIPKQHFNRHAVERHAQKYVDRLNKSEIELIDQPFEIEIIPYESLWNIILNNLSTKKRYKTSVS